MIANLILSVCMLILSGVLIRETSSYPDFSGNSIVGPEAIPNILAGFIAIIIALREIYRCVKGRNASPTYDRQSLPRARRPWAS